MQRRIYFLRHAKSDWSVAGQKDFDRELNSRGMSDAPKMGKVLFEKNVKPDLIVSSPAARAKLTAELVAEQMKYDPETIFFNEEIYEASARTLLNVINDLNDEQHTIMLVGHNPGFTYIAEYLTKEVLDNIPTCGIVAVVFEADSWKEISQGTGKMEWFLYPKGIAD